MKSKKISQSMRQKFIQFAALVFCNLHFENFISGKVYNGSSKNFCSPGLNCYSCPAAVFSCPLGALQTVAGSQNFKFSFYVTGFLFLIGLIFGRAVCGFLCPFGFFQDLLNKIPSRKFILPRPLTYAKYFFLIIFVLTLPAVMTNFAGAGESTFCQYICPAGTLTAGLPLIATHKEFLKVLGELFSLKIFILSLTIIGSIFVSRFFCKVLCPLGAIYGFFNKISFYRLQVNFSECVNCGACEKSCPMSVNPVKNPDSPECILCGKCSEVCPTKSISTGFNFVYGGKGNLNERQNYFDGN